MNSRTQRFWVHSTMDHVAVDIRGNFYQQPKLQLQAPSGKFSARTIIVFVILLLVVTTGLVCSYVPNDIKVEIPEMKHHNEENDDLDKGSHFLMNIPRIDRGKLENGCCSPADGQDSWYWDMMDDRRREKDYSVDLMEQIKRDATGEEGIDKHVLLKVKPNFMKILSRVWSEKVLGYTMELNFKD